MTADTKLLSLLSKQALDLHIPSGVRLYGHSNESMQDYARACVAHALAPLQAEVEALRAEVKSLQTLRDVVIENHGYWKDRAERLEEALREAQKLFEWNAIGGPLRRRIDALLRDHGKEEE